MLLQVRVPAANVAFRSGILTKWHVAEGDEVAFGAPICSVAIDEFTALQRTKRATLLGSTSKRKQRKVFDAYDLREGRGVVNMMLRSAEVGATLHRIVIAEGARVDVGDVIGTITVGTEGDAGTAGSDQLIDARISVEMPDAADFDEDLVD